MTDPLAPPPLPTNPLAYHRILSPQCSLKVSPICIGGISLGSSWSSAFGTNADAFALLDQFHAQGGNFIDTSNTYNSGESESLLGEWMESRGTRDQMIIATKYTSGYVKHDASIKIQSNYFGNNGKSMHLSLRDSLAKLRTSYIDIFYVHWWDFATPVEDVMRRLHSYVQSHQVLYLGASDLPAWVVAKANMFARAHGLTPFSVYQGRWNSAYRDMEAELIPMAESEGMAIVPWAALGGGQLMSRAQREAAAKDENARPAAYSPGEDDVRVCEAIEAIAGRKACSFQAVALGYLFAQSTYVFPIVGVQSVEHVKAMDECLKVELTREEVKEIQSAGKWKPQFPTDFLFEYGGDGERYHARMGAGDLAQTRMWGHFDAPRKDGGFMPHSEL